MTTRRNLLIGASAVALSGCKVLDGIGQADSGLGRVIAGANGLTYRAQRLLGGGRALAPEYTAADIRQGMHPNGSTNPSAAAYLAAKEGNWAGYRLNVTGLVNQPLSLTLDAVKSLPARRQITRHDCVEGWSCIAEWTGVNLSTILSMAEPTADARFVVFHCYDEIDRTLAGIVNYYESIDFVDALHPQTILAWGMNGADLPVRNGAPLRVRIERQLGYKMAKFIHTIELVAGFEGLGRGRGGYWPDRGYDWYAGI
jgi:DMSO/TMAO reductase YedYZ molybdopterin-dependent catalytic subunit